MNHFTAGTYNVPVKEIAFNIIEQLPIALFLFDSDGSLQYANSAGLKEFSEVLGAPFRQGGNLDGLLHQIVSLAVYQDETGKILLPHDAPVMEALRSGQVVRKIIKRYVKRTGNTIWYVNLGIPLRDEQGNIAWSISANIDITPQQTNTESILVSTTLLKEHAAQLERALRQHKDWLAQSNFELTCATGDLQQFIHVASHDLKEPVRKIRTYASRLLKDLKDVIPQTASHQLERIDNAAVRLMHMIDGLVLYSRLDDTLPIVESVDLSQLLGTISNNLKPSIRKQGAKVIVGDLPTVIGVPQLLQQLFTNLLSNALRFIPQGVQAAIHLSAANEQEEETSYWVISVADNGMGIPEAYRAQIFKPFVRLHSKDVHEGAGLGLSICQKIAAYHGGKIKVTGNDQDGTTFHVYLPRQQSQ